MDLLKNKKLWGFIVIAIVLLFSSIFLTLYNIENKNKDSYFVEVKSVLVQIEEVSKDLEGIDVNQDMVALLDAYDKIIGLADGALDLKAPSSMSNFDNKFKAYMLGTREGYKLIHQGTAEGDFELVSKGIKELSSLDDSFLEEIR